MKMKEIEYLIEFAPYQPGYDTSKQMMTGYALDANITEADGTPVRICIREKCRGECVADHYDTGRSIGGTFHGSLEECAEAAAALARQVVSGGRYHAALVKAGYRRK